MKMDYEYIISVLVCVFIVLTCLTCCYILSVKPTETETRQNLSSILQNNQPIPINPQSNQPIRITEDSLHFLQQLPYVTVTIDTETNLATITPRSSEFDLPPSYSRLNSEIQPITSSNFAPSSPPSFSRLYSVNQP